MRHCDPFFALSDAPVAEAPGEGGKAFCNVLFASVRGKYDRMPVQYAWGCDPLYADRYCGAAWSGELQTVETAAAVGILLSSVCRVCGFVSVFGLIWRVYVERCG